MKLTMRLVVVEWVDARSNTKWTFIDEMQNNEEPLHCRSVGWVVTDNKDILHLVSSISGEKNDNIRLCAVGDIAIPKGNVRKITVLDKASKVSND